MIETNPRKNAEGYPDPTAYNGMKGIIAEETAIERRLSALLKTLKYIIGLSGFQLVNRIELKDTKTGRVYR